MRFTNFAVVRRPGYGNDSKLTVQSSHTTRQAADKKAASCEGYMVIESDAKRGEPVYANSLAHY